MIQPHLEFLDKSWSSTRGIGFAAEYAPRDADGTSVVHGVFAHFGMPKPLDPVLFYEEDAYFRCFSLEANFSISTNIHVLDALLRAGLDITHPAVQKVVHFLSKQQHAKGFWSDKWHVSPYYTTAHAMIAFSSLSHSSIDAAIQWMLASQKPEGAWGFYTPTAEETAYCLLALMVCKKRGYSIPAQAIRQGKTWLLEHHMPPYTPLWIGKCLYTPINVIRASILSALILTETL